MNKIWEVKVSCPGWFDMELPSILSWHTEDFILETTFGMTSCAWSHPYECAEWYKCNYVYLTLGKKSHTCEEGGAQLRISFWHLLMNFEKPEKSEFWKNEKKKFLEILSFYTFVPKATIIGGTVPEIQS